MPRSILAVCIFELYFMQVTLSKFPCSLLSPETLAWTASTGRFVFHKDTCCDPKVISQKLTMLQAVPDSIFRFYNANIETLGYSLDEGGHGFSGICGTRDFDLFACNTLVFLFQPIFSHGW